MKEWVCIGVEIYICVDVPPCETVEIYICVNVPPCETVEIYICVDVPLYVKQWKCSSSKCMCTPSIFDCISILQNQHQQSEMKTNYVHIPYSKVCKNCECVFVSVSRFPWENMLIIRVILQQRKLS